MRVYWKTNISGELPKKEGAWTVCRFRGGGCLAKKNGGVFEGGGWYSNADYESVTIWCGVINNWLEINVLNRSQYDVGSNWFGSKSVSIAWGMT